MWPFKRKKRRGITRVERKSPFGELRVDNVVVRVWLNGQIPFGEKSFYKWGFSIGRETKAGVYNSFDARDLLACEYAFGQLRRQLASKGGERPTSMREFLDSFQVQPREKRRA